MKKIIYVIWILLSMFSCSGKVGFKNDISKLYSKSIIIPKELFPTYNGADTVVNEDFIGDIKYVIYIDSTDCSSCTISNLYLWDPFLKYAESLSRKLSFYFIFENRNADINGIKVALRDCHMNYPIFIDKNGCFERLNPHLPKNKAMHTFLLDENNNVILVGNPLKNKEIEKLFYKKTQELLSK